MRAEVTSPPLYIPLSETCISTAGCRHYKIHCHRRRLNPGIAAQHSSLPHKPAILPTAHRRQRTPQLKRPCSEHTKSPPDEKHANIHNYKNNKSTSINHPNMCNEPQRSHECNNIIHRWQSLTTLRYECGVSGHNSDNHTETRNYVFRCYLLLTTESHTEAT